ncbi:MAG: hypothetical protein DMG93_13755 [Acidobacteria bacterium]|nr:MAG: hypothetical protein DMG93_13755 [Acidobacteriota bacterium]
MYSVLLNSPGRNPDSVLSTIRDLDPEAVVLGASFQDELAILRTRSRWPNTMRVTASVEAGITSFGSQFGRLSDES